MALASMMSASALMAERTEFTNVTFDFQNKKVAEGTIAVGQAMTFSDETGYGYDFGAGWDGKSNVPFFFSVNVPDGNYRVTVTLGSKKKAGMTTVRAESRRLFVDGQTTAKGKTATCSFIVNKRNLEYKDESGKVQKVKVKERELTKRNWDEKLTLEFNGDAPCVQQVKIEKVDCPTIYLCGNSTVVDQDYEPWASWGQMITRYLDSEVAVANYAESGETAEGFIQRGRLAKILSVMKEGDYIFVEFGHNDQKTDNKVGNGAFYNFQHNLKVFYDQARARKAQLVLCTPTRRRVFDANGKIQDTHKDYPEAVRFMANRESIPMIDLQEMTKVMYEAWGDSTSTHALVHYPANTYPNQPKALADNTHFNPFGAMQIAKCVLQGIKDLKLPLAQHILGDFTGFDPAKPEVWSEFKWNDSPFTEMEKPDGN